jgi:calcineurin-like phosphoesterase family protein
MKIYVIADTHFGHANMVKYHNRPEQFDRILVDNWNAMVGKEDVVFHLGDIAFKRDLDMFRLMKKLHGRKILCLGNHDKQKPEWYMEQGFAFACTYYIFKGVCFSHKPVTPLPPGCTLNIHGHFQSDNHRDFEYAEDDYYHRHRYRYRLVQIEDSLSPVALEEMLGTRTAQTD